METTASLCVHGQHAITLSTLSNTVTYQEVARNQSWWHNSRDPQERSCKKKKNQKSLFLSDLLPRKTSSSCTGVWQEGFEVKQSWTW
jgi:hypothetical protein